MSGSSGSGGLNAVLESVNRAPAEGTIEAERERLLVGDMYESMYLCVRVYVCVHVYVRVCMRGRDCW